MKLKNRETQQNSLKTTVEDPTITEERMGCARSKAKPPTQHTTRIGIRVLRTAPS